MKKIVSALLLLFSLYSWGMDIPNPDSILTWHTRPPVSIDPRTGQQTNSFIDELALFLRDQLHRVGVFDVFVGVYTETVQKNNAISPAVPVSRILAEYREALVVTDAHYKQAGIQKSGEITVLPLEPDSLTLSRYKKVQTKIVLVSYFFDVETKNLLGDFHFNVSYTGGDAEKSFRKAFEKLENKVLDELKRIYWYSTDIDSVENNRFRLALGSKNGITRGMAFEIMEPDREWIVGERLTTVPGGRAGFARVTGVKEDSSRLRILRQWRQLYPGSWAVEQDFSVHALQLNIVPPVAGDYINFGALVCADPIGRFDWGLGMQFMRVTDTRWEDDYGFGFGAFGLWRFLNGPRYDLGLRLGLDLDLPFKKDDTGEIVNTVLFSSYLGLMFEFPVSQRSDFFLMGGYRFGFGADEWSFSEEEESLPAWWEESPPRVDNTGALVSFGFKYYFFGF